MSILYTKSVIINYEKCMYIESVCDINTVLFVHTSFITSGYCSQDFMVHALVRRILW
jgi:hypothetical protein